MPIPLSKEEYRPTAIEVTSKLMENPEFAGYVRALVTAYLDGTMSHQEDKLRAFSTLTKQLVGKTEDGLINEHFDQKDY